MIIIKKIKRKHQGDLINMNKIGIITIIDNMNLGNRLQNYALECKLKTIKNNILVVTIKYNSNGTIRIIKNFIKQLLNKKFKNRIKNFSTFNKAINITKINNNKINDFNNIIVGSDQVWNPNFGRLSDEELLLHVNPSKRVSYAASFGITKLPEQYEDKVRKELSKFKAISVREDAGKKIVEELTERTDVEVLVDPTMLLTSEEWDKVSKKPTMLHTDKYILNYYLGELSDSRKEEINRVAKENNCEIINILDKNSPFYECGPSEFLYLEKNAFLICTDSFHSCVFAILYNTPFLVFDREQEGLVSMNSRIDTLLSKFKLEDRRYSNKITDKDLKCDYTEAHKILNEEKIKSDNFLKISLDIKK